MRLKETLWNLFTGSREPDPYPEITHGKSRYLIIEAEVLAAALNAPEVFEIAAGDRRLLNLLMAQYLSELLRSPVIAQSHAPSIPTSLEIDGAIRDDFNKDFKIPYTPDAQLEFSEKTHRRAIYNLSRTGVLTTLALLNQIDSILPQQFCKGIHERLRNNQPLTVGTPYTVGVGRILVPELEVTQGMELDIAQMHRTATPAN